MIEVKLPLPPTSNHLFFTLKTGGRAKSAAYKAWIADADLLLKFAWSRAGRPEWPKATPMRLDIVLGLTQRRRDASNCIKPIEDALCRALPVPDDRYNDHLTVTRDPTYDGLALVRLYPLEAA
jgi:Holliday junction resolvase RusA-like endonuclease